MGVRGIFASAPAGLRSRETAEKRPSPWMGGSRRLGLGRRSLRLELTRGRGLGSEGLLKRLAPRSSPFRQNANRLTGWGWDQFWRWYLLGERLRGESLFGLSLPFKQPLRTFASTVGLGLLHPLLADLFPHLFPAIIAGRIA